MESQEEKEKRMSEFYGDQELRKRNAILDLKIKTLDEKYKDFLKDKISILTEKPPASLSEYIITTGDRNSFYFFQIRDDKGELPEYIIHDIRKAYKETFPEVQEIFV